MQQAGKAATKSAPQSPVVSAYSQSLKPKFNVQKTVTLFDHLSSKKLGDQFGAVQLRELGILVHPGVSSPTEAVFSINGQMNSTTFATWMSGLPPEALALPDAGVAGVELFLDERSTGRVIVDRHTNSYHTFDLTGVRELKVVVDNGNGKSLYDWLFLGVM
jgi:hypothetical protein